MSGLKEATAKTLQEEQRKLELTLHSLKMILKSGGTKFQRAALANIIKQVERRNTDPKAIGEAQQFISENKNLLDESRMQIMNAALDHLSEIHHQREKLEFKQADLQAEITTSDPKSDPSPADLKKELKEITKALDSTKPSFLQRIVNTISSVFSSSKKNEAIGTDAILLNEANASPQKPASASSLAHSAPPPPPALPNQAARDAIDQLNTESEYRGPK